MIGCHPLAPCDVTLLWLSPRAVLRIIDCNNRAGHRPSNDPNALMTNPLDPAWLSRQLPSGAGAAEVGLLVSVRSAAEWRRVVGLPVTVLDLKEPRRGALAAVSPELWRQAAREVPPHQRLSAALGEWDEANSLAALVPERFAFAKAGPARVAGVAGLRASWRALGERLAPGVELVAVAYADHQLAECPEPEEIFQAAAQAGLRTWLVDTYDKTGGDSICRLGRERLQRIAALAQRHRARWVLAGSLRQAAAGELLAQGVRPTLFGVRGDVCAGDRTQQISPSRVSDWLQLLGEPTDAAVRSRGATIYC